VEPTNQASRSAVVVWRSPFPCRDVDALGSLRLVPGPWLHHHRCINVDHAEPQSIPSSHALFVGGAHLAIWAVVDDPCPLVVRARQISPPPGLGPGSRHWAEGRLSRGLVEHRSNSDGPSGNGAGCFLRGVGDAHARRNIAIGWRPV